jgi:uncharacterized membrane protein YidH (DUF202 family)
VTDQTPPGDIPEKVVDPGLQHERTTLAWERTAIAAMVAGLLLGRSAAGSGHWIGALAGMVQVVVGASILVWAGWRYSDLHEPIRNGDDIVHPTAARLLGLATICFTGVGSLHAIVLAANL